MKFINIPWCLNAEKYFKNLVPYGRQNLVQFKFCKYFKEEIFTFYTNHNILDSFVTFFKKVLLG
jgi:hypothetical protein